MAIISVDLSAVVFGILYMLTSQHVFAQNAETTAIAMPSATTLGSFCTQDTDCLGNGIICKKPNNGCPYGECGCPDGYSYDKVAFVCKGSSSVGQPCGDDRACKQLNSVCTDGLCGCVDGYTKRSSLDKIYLICVPKTALGLFGEKCTDSNQCVPPLVCSSTTQKCTCDIGYKYTGNVKRLCAPKSVNDACAADDECLVANAYCRNSTCLCAGGYRQVPWRVQFREPLTGTYTAWTITACVGAVEPMYTTGSQCLTALRRSVSTACDSDNICIPCNPNVNNTGFCSALKINPSPVGDAHSSSIIISRAVSSRYSALNLFVAIAAFVLAMFKL